MKANYYIWIEIQANKEVISDEKRFLKEMENCKKAGMDAVILSVKDTTGFAIYESTLAPHYSDYDEIFKREDYLLKCLETVHGLGMKLFAAFDVFAEGNKKNPHPKMPAIARKNWQTYVYGLDERNEPVIQPADCEKEIKTVGSIDDFGEIFVNPANHEVCEYELSLLEEIMHKYPIDGIVLDRVRYVGLSSDFSSFTKNKLEEYIGRECDWPLEIYRLEEKEKQLSIKYGRFFGEFLTLRAGIIKDFIEQVQNLVKEQGKNLEFLDYTGSWYPLYYQVGANWASETYKGTEYSWVKEDYRNTGYAEHIDGLLSGFYYPYVTEEEAITANQPAYWYSVEGSARMAYRVTKNAVPVIGSLFLEQYRQELPSMARAIKMCFQTSGGCMLFDLSYLWKNDWWEYVTVNKKEDVILEELKEENLGDLLNLWQECFDDSYRVSEERFLANTFKDPEYSQAASWCLRNREDNRLIGAVIAKAAKEEDTLYGGSGWISALLTATAFQNKGYGTLLYKRAETALIGQGVNKIYAGQDLSNFFSGIPAPTEEKLQFFKKSGFVINKDEHYDLEADVVCNDKLDSFQTEKFLKTYEACLLKEGEEAALYAFLEKEFPGRWLFTAKEHLENGGSRDNIVVLKAKGDMRITGFCMIQVKEDKRGGLGPIGIAKDIRGNCLGDFLVHQSLRFLREAGAGITCIDWTILKDFYGKFGFKPVRIYRGAYKEFKN